MKDPQEMTFAEKVEAIPKEDCPKELRRAWYVALALYFGMLIAIFIMV
jgi:hypothetical protein